MTPAPSPDSRATPSPAESGGHVAPDPAPAQATPAPEQTSGPLQVIPLGTPVHRGVAALVVVLLAALLLLPGVVARLASRRHGTKP